MLLELPPSAPTQTFSDARTARAQMEAQKKSWSATSICACRAGDRRPFSEGSEDKINRMSGKLVFCAAFYQEARFRPEICRVRARRTPRQLPMRRKISGRGNPETALSFLRNIWPPRFRNGFDVRTAHFWSSTQRTTLRHPQKTPGLYFYEGFIYHEQLFLALRRERMWELKGNVCGEQAFVAVTPAIFARFQKVLKKNKQ